MQEWRIAEDLAGSRLDKALAELLPELGIRGRRRLIASLGILVNGRPARAASRVKSGDLVQIPEMAPTNDAATGAFLLDWQEPYCFFYKPAGLHTVRVAGSNTSSLEAAVPSLVAEKQGDREIRLLQRLDFGTSGIVAGATSRAAEENYRKWEREGRIDKYYLAFLEGVLEEPVCASAALDTAKRRKSRVLDHKSQRRTCFTPLYIWKNGEDFPLAGFPSPKGPFTLAGCRLCAGQRHQVRAHAAWLGHPLVGDQLYGKGSGGFILQHFALDFPDHSVELKGAEFLKNQMPNTAREAIAAWLAEERRMLP